MEVPWGHLLGRNLKTFLNGVHPQVNKRLEEEIEALRKVKFQLSLWVLLWKNNTDGTIQYTNPVLCNKQEALLQASEIGEVLDKAFAYLGASWEMDSRRLRVDCWQSGDSLAGYRQVPATLRQLPHFTPSGAMKEEGMCLCKKQGRPLPFIVYSLGHVSSRWPCEKALKYPIQHNLVFSGIDFPMSIFSDF